MNIVSDWHIHSRNSCDSACMTVADLVAEAERKGIADDFWCLAPRTEASQASGK